ncbi:MAG TPA: hypothetical protein VKP69_10465 [Isosphaeraceae bacterium]|nr:hypothetical protein [Isosphaeraceae bacterium]
MTLQAKVLTAGLLVASLPTMAVAQVVNERVQAQPGQVQPGAAAATLAADNQQQTQQVIAHALGMAIGGSELQFAAHSARGGRRQNRSDGNNNQDRRDRANENDNADNQAHRQAVQQLQQQASHQFEGSNQLFQETDNDLRTNEANAVDRAEDRSEWSRRLYTVANQYANTLRNLSGANNRPSGSVGRQNDQEQANNNNPNQSGSNLSRTEIAQVTLINHAVSEALGAFELAQRNNANRSAAQSASGQRLQAHARQMSSESQQILQNLIAMANWRDNNADPRNDNPNNNDDQNNNDRNNAQGGQPRQASVQSLAQQAQQVIDTLQRISARTQGAGAVAPGAVR